MSDEAIKAALDAGADAAKQRCRDICDIPNCRCAPMSVRRSDAAATIAAFLRDRARDAEERGVVHLAYTFRKEAADVERAAKEDKR